MLRIFNILPSTTPNPLIPPLTHTIHALINIPVSPYASKWFSPPSPPPETVAPSSSPHSHRLSTSEQFHKAFARLSMSKNSLSHRSSSRPPTPISTASSPPTSTSGSPDTLRHAYDLLDTFTERYLSGDPDSPAVRQKCLAEDVQVEDSAIPLAVLITRLVKGDEGAKKRMRDWLLPSDLYDFPSIHLFPLFLVTDDGLFSFFIYCYYRE